MPCPICRGTRHVRGPAGWSRCTCIAAVLSSTFVHATLRAHDETPPEQFTPLPADATLATAGSWDTFRRNAWGTLLTLEPEGITHDVVFFHRLSDIVTGRERTEDDPESDAHMHLRDLVRLDVLVIIISPFDITNRLTRSVFGNLLDERSNMRRATWIFTHVTGGPLWSLLDRAISTRWFAHLTDAHAAPAAVGPAPRSGGPGADAVRQPSDAPGGGATRRYR